VTPILVDEANEKLFKIFDVCLRDRRKAWVLNEERKHSQPSPDGPAGGPETVGTHET
jgi:hypothetical protein